MRRHPLPPLQQPIADTRYLTIEEAAQYLRRTPKAIRRLVERRKIPHLKTGRWITFDRETLDRWMKEQERVAIKEDVEKGGHYDARTRAINCWTHHWLNRATRQESEIFGTFHFRWGDQPALVAILTDEGFSLEDLLQELGRLEQKALGVLKHGDTPTERARPCP